MSLVLLLYPIRRGRECVYSPVDESYGEKKRKREAAKVPLLADVPGVLRTPDEYAQRANARRLGYVQKMRSSDAQGWRQVRRWRDQATPEDRAEFAKTWGYLPHAPEYALDAIRRIARCALVYQLERRRSA